MIKILFIISLLALIISSFFYDFWSYKQNAIRSMKEYDEICRKEGKILSEKEFYEARKKIYLEKDIGEKGETNNEYFFVWNEKR
jgi:hypothetical protein